MKRTKIRMVGSAKGLRAMAERAPEVEAFAQGIAQRVHRRLDPTLVVLYRLRRRLATGGVLVLTTWLFVHVMFGANGMVVYRQKKDEYRSLQKEIDSLQRENDQYVQEIQNLKTDPKTIEKEAREQLHYARPGEVVYVAPAAAPEQRLSTDAARK